MKLFTSNPNSSKGMEMITIDQSNKLGAGATATVYSTKFKNRSVAAKVYDKQTAANKDKLIGMIKNGPPENLISEQVKKNIQLAWPLALLVDKGGIAVGYLMPIIDIKRSRSLEYFYEAALLKRLVDKDQRALSFKLEIARNLATLIAALHKQRHYFIDIKPQNIRVYLDTHLVALLDCDGFSIAAKPKRFPAELVSTDYISPEATILKKSPKNLGENQDRYALAVLLFQLLNSGTHPFQGILKKEVKNANTNDQKAANNLYPHGLRGHSKILPRPQSVHRLWDNETRALFDRAFIPLSSQVRPTAREWAEHFDKILKEKTLRSCTKFPKNIEHMRFKGKQCPACYLLNLEVPTPKKKRVVRHIGKKKSLAASNSMQSVNPTPSTNNVPWGAIIWGLCVLALVVYISKQ